jgi:hypothetical protein
VDELLFELDKVMDDDEIELIPSNLVEKCTRVLILLSIDGWEDSNFPRSTSLDHADADRLVTKLRQVHLELGGNIFDRKGFIRDVFTLNDHQWVISAEQYYSFIDYYDNPIKPNAVFKLIQWTVYPADFKGGFAPAYHLERSYSEEFGFTYILGRKLYPHYHESLINFLGRCPSYAELKPLIIGDVTGEAPLSFIVASGYRE